MNKITVQAILPIHFQEKNFDTVELARNTIKSKFTYNDWGIAFHGEGSWSFDNDSVRKVLIYGVDNLILIIKKKTF